MTLLSTLKEVVEWELLPEEELKESIVFPLQRLLESLNEAEDLLHPTPPRPEDEEYQDREAEVDAEVGHSSPPDHEMNDREDDIPTTRRLRLDIADGDMEAYLRDRYDQQSRMNSVTANQQLLNDLTRILAESEKKMDEDELNTTGWYAESSLSHSIWPRELWRMFRKDVQHAEAGSSWEIALYRITQLLSLVLDIPANEVNHIISGSTWDVIEFYGAMLHELGGPLEGRYLPTAHKTTQPIPTT